MPFDSYLLQEQATVSHLNLEDGTGAVLLENAILEATDRTRAQAGSARTAIPDVNDRTRAPAGLDR